MQNDGSSLFTQTFRDTVITFKTNPTPARAKNPKPDLDLGLRPLEKSVQKSLDYKSVPDSSKLPRVTSTITRPAASSVMAWENAVNISEVAQQDMGEKLQRDMNFNLPVHTDQYGNGVQVEAPINQGTMQQDMGFQGPEPIFTQPIQDTPQAPNIDLLRANPVIQRLVEERVALLKARMKSEFSQGNANNRRKSVWGWHVGCHPSQWLCVGYACFWCPKF